MTLRVSSVFLLTSGALWVWWLSALSTVRRGAADRPPKCRDILPGLRTLLYIITSVLLLLLVCAGIATMAGNGATAGEKFEGLCLLSVVIAMTVVQLMYLQSVRFSEKTVDDDCTTIERARRRVLIIIASVFLLAGAIGIIDGGPSLTKESKRKGGRGKRKGGWGKGVGGQLR